MEKQWFSNNEKGTAIVQSVDEEASKNHLESSLPVDLLSALDPIYASLMMDTLYYDFQFYSEYNPQRQVLHLTNPMSLAI